MWSQGSSGDPYLPCGHAPQPRFDLSGSLGLTATQAGAANKDLALRGGLEPLMRTIDSEVEIRIINDS